MMKGPSSSSYLEASKELWQSLSQDCQNGWTGCAPRRASTFSSRATG